MCQCKGRQEIFVESKHDVAVACYECVLSTVPLNQQYVSILFCPLTIMSA